MTNLEVMDVVRELQTWVGAQLQEIVIDGIKGEDPRSLRLGFFWTGGTRWLVFDYRVQAPLVVLFDGQDGVPMTPPKTAGKIRRPIELFLRSKHVGRRLRDVRMRTDEGRAFDLIFDPEASGPNVGPKVGPKVGSEVRIEIKAYPHGRNATAISGAQSVSEFKPMAPTHGETTGYRPSDVEAPPRSRRDLALQWLESVQPALAKKRLASGGPAEQPAEGLSQQKSPTEMKLEKTKKALSKVRAEIESKSLSDARDLGEWLKENQTLELPREWSKERRDMIDVTMSLAENIQKLFLKAKNQERKVLGTKTRATELEAEIAVLEKKLLKGDRGASDAPPIVVGSKDLFLQAKARGRKFQLAEDLIVYLGKNATENLSILRRAQPFDYWLHLKDRPGAHAILRRTRGRNVTDSELTRAGVYVAEQTMKRRAIDMKGEAFDLLIVECRFVRPIKGDKLGRVHYTNDRVLRIKL